MDIVTVSWVLFGQQEPYYEMLQKKINIMAVDFRERELELMRKCEDLVNMSREKNG